MGARSSEKNFVIREFKLIELQYKYRTPSHKKKPFKKEKRGTKREKKKKEKEEEEESERSARNSMLTFLQPI